MVTEAGEIGYGLGMQTREDLEAYIHRCDLPSEEVGQDMWVLRDSAQGEKIIVTLADSLVLFRMKVMELDGIKDTQPLFERLLSLNAKEMIHGSYGVADNAVLITCALRLGNLDYDEFLATLDDFSLAIGNHYPELSKFRPTGTN